MTFHLTLVAALVLTACGGEDRHVDVAGTGGAGAGGAGASGGVGGLGPEEGKAALVGAWRSTDIGQFANVLLSQDQTHTFATDGGIVSTGIGTFRASSPLFGGCLEEAVATGTFSVNGAPGNLYLGYQYTQGTTSRSGCADAADNATDLALTLSELALISSTGGSIVIADGSFALTNTLNSETATYSFYKQ